MPIAFHGLTGRTDATHVALAVAHVLAETGPVTLVRPLQAYDAELSLLPESDAGLTVVEVRRERDATTLGVTVAEIEIAQAHGRRVVLDLPAAFARDPSLTARTAVAVATVGHHDLDLARATRILSARPTFDGTEPRHDPWILACGGPGGRKTAEVARYRLEADAHPDRRPVRVLPVSLPSLTRDEAETLLQGRPHASAVEPVRAVVDLVEALRATPDKTDLAMPEDARPLRRRLDQKLRGVADDVAVLLEHGSVDRTATEGAPVLDDWSYVHVPRRALAGRVRNHARIADGRRIVTSDLFACDGRTWGRTLSSFYRLGKPASDG